MLYRLVIAGAERERMNLLDMEGQFITAAKGLRTHSTFWWMHTITKIISRNL